MTSTPGTLPVLTDFDILTTNNSTQLLKAMIPFLEAKEQRLFAIMIRIIEFNMTLDYFNSNKLSYPCSKKNDMRSMLNEIKKYCPPKEREQFEMMANMMMVQQMKTASSPVDLMGSFLSPEQLKKYKEYESML